MTVLTLSLVATFLLVSAAGFDLAFRAVPNWLPTALALDGAGLRLASGSLGMGLLAGATVFVACALLWRRGLMGGGDVKMLGAAALAVPGTGALLIATALAGGVLALVYLLLRSTVAPPGRVRPHPFLLRVARVEQRRILAGRSLPYCFAIAAGAVATLAGA